jgi:putative ABC transport system substrate-binding protein
MAAELVSLNPDVIVSSGNNATPYAKQASSTVPLVFMFIADPVGAKLVESFARPGGNATGISNFSSDLIPKRLELLKEAIPGLARVAQLVNPLAAVSRLYIELSQAAAANLQVSIQKFEARSRDELEGAFAAMTQAQMQAVLTNADGLAYAQREFIAELALKMRIPAAVWGREPLVTRTPGALLSYGVDALAICRRAAVFVDKILKGAKPADLPVEQPTNFEFLVNQRAAKALGITIPPSLLARADEVIE